MDWCARVQLKRDTTEVPALGTSWLGAENGMETMFDPPDQAKGRITAFDAENGLVRWKYRAGHPILAGVTPTAGGLVFIAATNDKRFRAFDSKTGKELWTTKLDMSAHAVPMTYQGKNGKQYVAAVATDQLLTFALP